MKFWIFVDHKLDGPIAGADLRKRADFHLELSVCPDGEDVWQPAKMYPELSNEEIAQTQFSSGDYAPGSPQTDGHVENWREAIIPAEFEERKTRLSSNRGPAANPAPATHPYKPRKREWPSLRRWLLKPKHSTWTMAAAWTIFFGLYIPKTDLVDQIFAGLIANSYATVSPYRILGHFPGGKGRRQRGQKLNPTNLKDPVPSGKKPASHIYKDLKSTETVLEEESSDLGNGMEIRTVMTVDVRDGQKIWKTHRYLRSRPGDRYEPL